MARAIPNDNLEFHHVGVLVAIHVVDSRRCSAAAKVASRHLDFTYRDLAIILRHSMVKLQIAGMPTRFWH